MAYCRAKGIDEDEDVASMKHISQQELDLWNGERENLEDLENVASWNPLLQSEVGRAMIVAKHKLTDQNKQLNEDFETSALCEKLHRFSIATPLTNEWDTPYQYGAHQQQSTTILAPIISSLSLVSTARLFDTPFPGDGVFEGQRSSERPLNVVKTSPNADLPKINHDASRKATKLNNKRDFDEMRQHHEGFEGLYTQRVAAEIGRLMQAGPRHQADHPTTPRFTETEVCDGYSLSAEASRAEHQQSNAWYGYPEAQPTQSMYEIVNQNTTTGADITTVTVLGPILANWVQENAFASKSLPLVMDDPERPDIQGAIKTMFRRHLQSQIWRIRQENRGQLSTLNWADIYLWRKNLPSPAEN